MGQLRESGIVKRLSEIRRVVRMSPLAINESYELENQIKIPEIRGYTDFMRIYPAPERQRLDRLWRGMCRIGPIMLC